ncbi:MAG: hypothetical protein JWP89_6318 [Schlesneria sp.]|nr:hypothetical protein [Schlesneria sp.]
MIGTKTTAHIPVNQGPLAGIASRFPHRRDFLKVSVMTADNKGSGHSARVLR